MTDYRRQLTKEQHKNIITKYKKHRDVKGGIFVSRTRRRLLGVKDEHSGMFREDTPDFWLDVRNNVKTTLTDLQLICEVANQDQLKEMFHLVTAEEREKDQTKSSLADVFSVLFDDKLQFKRTKEGWERITNPQQIIWKAELAHEVVEKCLKFYHDHGLVTSKAHERLVEEVRDMLGSEFNHAISRESKLPYYAKFR